MYKLAILLNLWILLDLISSGSSAIDELAGSQCKTKTWNRIPGSCKALIDCPSAISELRSGVFPSICPNSRLVCCPTRPRVSGEKCEEYKEILREPDGPTPLLPLDFLSERPKEIQCNKHVNKLIVGGREAQVDEFPHSVALGWGSDKANLEYRCGGTLISEKFVLTAAHCVETRGGRPTFVLLGDIRLSAAQAPIFHYRREIIRIASYVIHPEYRKPKTYNDIALIELEENATLSRSILPACLPQPSHRLETKLNMSAVGWGQLGTADNSSDILQAVTLQRFGLNECNEYYHEPHEKAIKYPEGIIRSQICAGDRKMSKDTCKGDSGGPLTVSSDQFKCVYYIMGITSFGSSICGLQPGVYTNVQSYLDWIEENVWPDEGRRGS